jgi:hypothetical protein
MLSSFVVMLTEPIALTQLLAALASRNKGKEVIAWLDRVGNTKSPVPLFSNKTMLALVKFGREMTARPQFDLLPVFVRLINFISSRQYTFSSRIILERC